MFCLELLSGAASKTTSLCDGVGGAPCEISRAGGTRGDRGGREDVAKLRNVMRDA